MLEGRIREAEEETKNLYPNLLESNPDLLFMLRCRHFVELVGQSMIRKDKPMEDEDIVSISNGNFCNGDTKESPNQESGDLKGCEEDMDVAYSNGYQNGCGAGDEMGKKMLQSFCKMSCNDAIKIFSVTNGMFLFCLRR